MLLMLVFSEVFKPGICIMIMVLAFASQYFRFTFMDYKLISSLGKSALNIVCFGLFWGEFEFEVLRLLVAMETLLWRWVFLNGMLLNLSNPSLKLKRIRVDLGFELMLFMNLFRDVFSLFCKIYFEGCVWLDSCVL